MTFPQHQRTLGKAVSCSGVGVHSGKPVNLTLKPASTNHGIVFVRTDLPDAPSIPAIFHKVIDTSMATVIGENGVIVSTIEHLMAAFSGMGIDNARVEIDAYEMPILDGSALRYADMIADAGEVTQDAPRCYLILKEPLHLAEGDKSVSIEPYDGYKITCTIEFPSPVIGKQSLSVDITGETFSNEIAGARTFGFYHELEHLKLIGLARGATLDSGIAIDGEALMNPEGLRFDDEFVRHKLLDCIGDFSLMGLPLKAHVITVKSGHAFNHTLLKALFENKSIWEARLL
ncbi:MAG: UDP-3-O-[3-hydroxymyristoyl] N-acetylglucosamine deacetylase [Deltaproteobacteria bacterium]|nr:MAG: UDP-3-O-[3-hydroxymyristoyl] N-acetylglucosamine deacetylase [Deltaproteobacteria bacterium]